MSCIFALFWIFNLAIAPSPSLTTLSVTADGSTAGPLRATATIWLTNNDPRYADFLVTIGPPLGGQITDLPATCNKALTCAVHAPSASTQGITITLAFSDVQPMCAARRLFGVSAFTTPLTSTEVLDVSEYITSARIVCSLRTHLPLI